MRDVCWYRDEIDKVSRKPRLYPQGRFSGAGIVVCAGGRCYFTCGWVLVNVLRELGCDLPIEVWYRGRREMSVEMRKLTESVDGVRCVNALDVEKPEFPCELRGWELKPFAITHCRFEDVLFIDCDNVPVRDPSFLLRVPQYRRLGAIFWPDRWMGERDPQELRTIAPEAWAACGMTPRDEPEIESGQMVINKRKCWKALRLTMFLNEHSDFFYQVLLGDKDTFHLAWRRIGQEYAMPMFRPGQASMDAPVLYQHDFQGRRLFQHRNFDKWDYDGGNLRIPGFQHEELCFRLLDELRRRWDGVVRRFPDDYTERERAAYDLIVSASVFRYARGSADVRFMELRPDFTIGLGKGQWETAWEVEEADDGVRLTIRNAMHKLCVLTQGDGSSWTGRCLHLDRGPVQLVPSTHLPGPERRAVEAIKSALACLPEPDGRHANHLRKLMAHLSEQAKGSVEEIRRIRFYIYRRAGRGHRLMEFLPDHSIGQGAGGHEQWWFVDGRQGRPELVLCGDEGPICRMTRVRGGRWTGRWLKFEGTEADLVPRPRG